MTNNQRPVIFSTDDYLIPQWTSLPKHQFFFEIIKNGSIVGNVPIKQKQFSLIGRLEDLCDIFIDNPSVSRKHAILQFQAQDPLPLLYDLGSAQGTFVNKQKLPPKVYKKIQLFTNIKFGVSSRNYILRCPQLEEKQNEEEQKKENEFLKSLSQQNKMLSKQQAKKKYLQLLQNDPYFGGQLKSRKLEGQQKMQRPTEQYEGITWGIADQNQVYAYNNQKQFPIEPDVIRRLPGLDQTMLQKIANYEQKFRLYDEIESELNQLASKEKREFGLEEKLQIRKQKLEKKFVQSLQALQKSEDWIRINIFGQQNVRQNNHNKKKQREVDTYSDDEFYDRTLEKKNRAKQEDQSKEKQIKVSQPTIQDLWMIKKHFFNQLAKKKELSQKINATSQKIQNQNNEAVSSLEMEDELELYMKENNQNLQQENNRIHFRQIDSIQQKLLELKVKLGQFLTQKEIAKLEQEILNPEKVLQKQQKKQQKEQQQRQKLEKTLTKLETQQKLKKQKQLKRQKMERQCEDECSEKIFNLYKEEYEEELNQQHQDDQDYGRKNQDDESYSGKRLMKKVHLNEEDDEARISHNDSLNENQCSLPEQSVIDLTVNFK